MSQRTNNERVAIVTGAAQGIGFAIAEQLHQDGMRVMIADLRGADEAAARLGGDAAGSVCDISDSGQVDAMVARTLERFGRVDVLVNNAGLYTTLKKQPFEQIEPDEWRRVFEVNVEGVWHCCRAVAGPMKQAKRGAIVNVASATVAKGPANLLHYVASKGAVVAMTRCLARELGDHGIRVNTVSPGFTLSDGVLAYGASRDAQKADVRSARILHDDVNPSDIANTVLYLATDRSRMLTGQNIMVDGGMVMN